MNVQFKDSNLTDVLFIHWTYGGTGEIGFTDGREDLFDEPGTHPPYTASGKDLKVIFLHGRRTVDEEMNGWGFHGGDAKKIQSVHVSYAEVTLVDVDGHSVTLPIVAGCVHVDAYAAQALDIDEAFYGDLEVVQPE